MMSVALFLFEKYRTYTREDTANLYQTISCAIIFSEYSFCQKYIHVAVGGRTV